MLTNAKGKKVIVRVDFNVPLDENQNITDDTRIVKSIPTILELLYQGASVILLSHLGRPLKELLPSGQLDLTNFSLENIVPHLSELLGVSVKFAGDCVGEKAILAASSLNPGEVLLVENTRFHKGEEAGDIDFAAQLASLGDAYVNDAFGTAHRAHASTATIAQFFKKEDKSFGLLMEAEITNASAILNSPRRPCTAIFGGAKVSDKIKLIEKFINFADTIIIGGGMAYTFIKAMDGSIGSSLCEDSHLDLALELLERAKEFNVKIVLPIDSVIADAFNGDANTKVVSSDSIPNGWMGLDIGPKAIESCKEAILSAQSIIWNGPLGVFEMEAFAKGTLAIAQFVAEATDNGAFSVIGGGDSVAAINASGLEDRVSFISTGGGAMLEFLEGKKLPGILAIEQDA